MNSTTPANEPLPEPLHSVTTAIADDEPNAEAMHEFLTELKRRPHSVGTDQTCVVEKAADGKAAFGRRARRVMMALAATVLVLFSLQHLPTANALEQLARALSGQKCIHMTMTSGDESNEHWLILDDRRSAWSNDRWIQYFDPTSDMVTTFNRQSGELVRTAGHGRQPNSFLIQFVQSLVDSSDGKQPGTIRGLKVVSSKTLEIDGKTTLQLRAKDNTTAQSIAADIVLDDTTGLPVTAHAVVVVDGEKRILNTRWDYPSVVPENIFALGVDPKTKLVDRIPVGDVKRIVGGVYAGRVAFDDYRAVVIRGRLPEGGYYGPGDITLVGHLDKRLVCLQNFSSLPSELQGKSRAEVAATILKKVDVCVWRPVRIVDGNVEYRFRIKVVPKNREGDTELKVEGYDRIDINLPMPEFIVPNWRSIPHFAGRPPLGVGRGDIAAAVVEVADGGPEDCVLLRTITSGSIPKAPSDPIVASSQTKGGYWIRADRDYLVIRSDSEFTNGIATTFSIDELAQSPNGRWYATKASKPESKQGVIEIAPTFFSYHLDFETLLPERMFDPQRHIISSPWKSE